MLRRLVILAMILGLSAIGFFSAKINTFEAPATAPVTAPDVTAVVNVALPSANSPRQTTRPAPPPSRPTPQKPVAGALRSVKEATNGTCGMATLGKLGIQFEVERIGESPLTIEVRQVGGNPHGLDDIRFSARALGPSMHSGLLSASDTGVWRIIFDSLDRGEYDVDVIVTWVHDKYLGQRWFLPDRNDNPPFEEKRRKCLSLKLVGDCERFGATIWHEVVTVSTPVEEAPCVGGGANGKWSRISPGDSTGELLTDPVGLNEVNGSAWKWSLPASCPSFTYYSSREAHQCLSSKKIRSIALFGDSMIVELFNAMRGILGARDAPVKHSKHKKLRSMEFSVEGVRVRFSRSYTTSQGHSVIANPDTVVDQIASTSPDMVVGNLAVLHWQQNERSVADWETNLRRFASKVVPRVRNVSPNHRFYLGHTLIQMGRTQGLNPSRTDSFSAAAVNLLTQSAGFRYLDPYNLSATRRESAFDGQHWACYHEYGGVSHTIAQLLMNAVCK